MTDDVYEYGEGDGGNVVPLEPLGKSRRQGIDAAMRAAFDVMYAAGEPLTVDEIATRTFDRVHPAVRYHAKRWYVRKLERDRVRQQILASGVAIRGSENLDVDERHAWHQHLAQQLRQAVQRGVVLRNDRWFVPNPARPPRLVRADGSIIRYTREAWSDATAADRAIGDIHAMGMEAERVLGNLDTDTLRQAVALVARKYITNPVDERSLRGRLQWLMERPSTDAGRAWLLTELVRRAYDSDVKPA